MRGSIYPIERKEQVPLGGLPQTIHIWGTRRANPVLLFLHGGPAFPTATALPGGTVIDAITDPWGASLSDNCKLPLGRRVVFMRWAAVPYGLFCLLVFFPPVGGASTVNAVWVGVMLILYYLFSTLYNIPYSALQAEIVAEPEKRVFLYTINSLFYVISSALVFCTSMIKSMLMSNGVPEIRALRIPFIAFCVLGAASALIPAFVIKERDYVAPKPYHQSILGALRATVSYPSFTVITVGYLVMWIAFTFFNTAEVYYITNLLALGDIWVTIVSVISIAVGVATYPLVNILARRVGKSPCCWVLGRRVPVLPPVPESGRRPLAP